jgi:hypothetical protein
MSNLELTRTLRSLDTAPEMEPDDVTRRRAHARREKILLSGDSGAGATAVVAPRRRWPVAVAGVATATGVFLAGALPPSTAAYASWRPTPTAATAAERTLAADACAHTSGRSEAEVVLTERRVSGSASPPSQRTRLSSPVSCIFRPVRTANVMVGVSGGQGAIPSGGESTDGAIDETGETTTGLLGIGATPAASHHSHRLNRRRRRVARPPRLARPAVPKANWFGVGTGFRWSAAKPFNAVRYLLPASIHGTRHARFATLKIARHCTGKAPPWVGPSLLAAAIPFRGHGRLSLPRSCDHANRFGSSRIRNALTGPGSPGALQVPSLGDLPGQYRSVQPSLHPHAMSSTSPASLRLEVP